MHPHISIEDRVFVETVGGDLTIKIENNTDSGEGIYAEPVDDPDQTLDDARFFYAIVGNLILLKIRPYQEETFRYLVYNEKIQQVSRLDAIARRLRAAARRSRADLLQRLLPADRRVQDLRHEHVRACSSSGGSPRPTAKTTSTSSTTATAGIYVLLRYNLIEQRVDTPIVCNGFSLFRRRRDGAASRRRTSRRSITPCRSGRRRTSATTSRSRARQTDSFLYKIGNRDIVRGMAECHESLGLIDKEDTYANLYVDLVKQATDVLDTYFWARHAEAVQPGGAAGQHPRRRTPAVEEFEKVARVRKNTARTDDEGREPRRETS